MPLYEFFNTETKEYFEDILTIKEKERLLELNSHIKSVPSKFGIISGVGDIHSKTDSSWKEVLSRISEKHPTSPLADSYGNRTHKEIKSQEILKKYREKWKNK